MARPSKPTSVIMLEGVSHRTKAELKTRSDAEKAMLTGTLMRMSFNAKEHETAAKEFHRIKNLLGKVGKDDALYAQTINTYCILVEETEQVAIMRDKFSTALDEFEDRCHSENLEYAEIIKDRIAMQKQILDCDKQLQSKRKMILDISKENIMTIQSALRAIPKKPEEKEKSGMAAFMEKRRTGG